MTWQTLQSALLGNLERDGWAALPMAALSQVPPEKHEPLSSSSKNPPWFAMVSKFASDRGLRFKIDEGNSQVVFHWRIRFIDTKHWHRIAVQLEELPSGQKVLVPVHGRLAVEYEAGIPYPQHLIPGDCRTESDYQVTVALLTQEFP